MAEPTFEELYRQLEEKANKLDEGKLPLEESIKLYEEGVELVDKLREKLSSAELRVRTLEGRLAEDNLVLRDVDAEYDAEFEGE